MLSRLVVSLIILNVCGVHLLCLWLCTNVLLIVFIETRYSCRIAYVSLVHYIYCIYSIYVHCIDIYGCQ